MRHKGDPLTQCKNWSYSVSYSPRTNLRWDLKLRCLTEGRRSLGSLTHTHSQARTLITPSTTAVMTSDWWWQWRWRVLRKDALGHRVRVSFVVFFSEFSSLLYKLVHFMQASGSMCVLHRHAWRVRWGTPMTRHMWWMFLGRAGVPVERQVVHAGVHMFFFCFLHWIPCSPLTIVGMGWRWAMQVWTGLCTVNSWYRKSGLRE